MSVYNFDEPTQFDTANNPIQDENGQLIDIYGNCLSDEQWAVKEKMVEKEGDRA